MGQDPIDDAPPPPQNMAAYVAAELRRMGRTNSGRFASGRSGNPGGRPTALRDYRTWIAARLPKLIRKDLDTRLGVALRQALRAGRPDGLRWWETALGYSVSQLRTHLERRFSAGMTWPEFHRGRIHIDHVIARMRFAYTYPDEPGFLGCWALSNLQPLWAKDNCRKARGERGSRAHE
jgi:hypothetical protein